MLDTIVVGLAVVFWLCVLGWVISFVEKMVPMFTGFFQLIGSFFQVIASVFLWLARLFAPSIYNKVASQEVSGTPTVPANLSEASKINEAELKLVMPQANKPEAASEILNFEIGKKALVVLRYYQNGKTVSRNINVLDSKLQGTYGKRMVMSPLSITGRWEAEKSAIIKQSRKDAKLALGILEESSEVASLPVGQVNPASMSTQDTVQTKNVLQEVEMPQDKEIVESAPPSTSQEQDEQARKSAKAISKGILRWHGMADRNSKGKDFQHYRLDYLDDETQLVETLWGTDLKRAISSCGASVNDHIEIFQLGRKKVENDGNKEPSYMTRYHVVKLKK